MEKLSPPSLAHALLAALAVAACDGGGGGSGPSIASTSLGGGSFEFAEPVNVAPGNGPVYVDLGDFDDDGRADLVVANEVDGTVAVLRNETESGVVAFAPPAAFPVGSLPVSLDVGDLDGDSLEDLVVATSGFDQIAVLRNAFDRSVVPPAIAFAPVELVPTGSGPVSVRLADFDLDGDLDLAVAERFSASVSIHPNRLVEGAPGTFAPRRTFDSHGQPVRVRAGDLDLDGRPDLALANESLSSATVLLNRTDPAGGPLAFAPPESTVVAFGPRGLELVDLDDDTRPDVVYLSDANRASVLLQRQPAPGDPDGLLAFDPPVTVATVSFPRDTALGDLDGDGATDVAVAAELGRIEILAGDPLAPGGLSPAQELSFGLFLRSIAAGDLDGDLRTDLAVVDVGFQRVSVLVNVGAPLPPPPPPLVPPGGIVPPAGGLPTVGFQPNPGGSGDGARGLPKQGQ